MCVCVWCVCVCVCVCNLEQWFSTGLALGPAFPHGHSAVTHFLYIGSWLVLATTVI